MSHQITLLVQAQEKVSCCVSSSSDSSLYKTNIAKTFDKIRLKSK